jgi:Xaa-Pro aminopeptidase
MPEPLASRRARVAATLPLGDAVLLVGAGEPVPLPENSDQTYPFRAHADYVYLTGIDEAGGVMAFDPQGTSGADGGWKHFVRPVSEAERVWEGRQPTSGLPLDHLDAWLHARRNRPFVCLGAPLARLTIDSDASLTPPVREAFLHARRPKDNPELDLIRRAVAATTRGYRRLPDIIRPGVSERAVQVELEAEFFRGGGRRTGYGTIVGSGPNSAVLHFEPSARTIRAGEFVLVDAGAEIDRYVADVTRTYVAGAPTGFQRDLHAAVLHAEQRAIARCVVGAEWKATHLAAALDLVGSLVDLKILFGQPESLVEREAHTLFFPHGLGHMVGLGVRDASGLAPGRNKDPRASLRSLRMDLPLQAGYVVTVEPGLYFIPPLLLDPTRRERFRDAVNWPLVDTLLDLGGVRIEDNVLVTAEGPQVLTADIPHVLTCG